MKNPSPLRRVLVPLGIVAAVLAVVSVGIAVSPLGNIFASMISVTRNHENLKTRGDAHELGAVMVDVLRDPAMDSADFINGDDERIPVRLRDLGASYLLLDQESGSARLEFGGGFYHYGYEVQAEGVDRYRMICYGENEDDIVELGTFKYKEKPLMATPNQPPD